MTTSNFLLRMQRFSSLDKAANLFSSHNSVDFIYHVTGSLINNTSIDLYVLSLKTLPDSLTYCEYNSLFFLKFSRYDFQIQLKFFKSFLQTISKCQYNVLKDNHSCDSLLLELGLISTEYYFNR